MYKLVATDLDGTLLNSKKQISEVNKKAVKAAIEAGVKFIVCSGRIYAGARVFAREIGVKEPVIACNGAIIKDMDSENTLYSELLARTECYRVIELCHESEIYFHVYIGDTMFTEKLGFSSLSYWNRNRELPLKDRVDIQLVEDMRKIIESHPAQPSKIVIVSEDSELLFRTRKAVEGIPSVDVMSSDAINFEVMNRGVNKGRALKYLAEKMGIKREEVLAIGDNENDASMLEYAGLGVVMANAGGEIKRLAGYVGLSNDEDGVAEALHRFVL